MALDQTMTLPATAQNGCAVPVKISDIVGACGNLNAKAGQHTVTSGEALAGTCSIASGVTTLVSLNVQIIRAGAVITGDAAVSFSAGNIVVASGGSVYVMTAGDVINWIAVGS